MSLKNLCLFEHLRFSTSPQSDKRITFLILLGMVFVLTLTLFGFAFIELEYDELPIVESGPITWIKGFLSHRAFLHGLHWVGFAPILLFEYLRSHIGEKRFSEDTVEFGIPLFDVINDSLKRLSFFV